MQCNHTLSTLDLVPIFSFLFLGGRCRYCASRLSVQYVWVEIVAALLSLGIFLAEPNPVRFTLALVLWMTLLFVVVYDIRHKILPIPGLWIIGIAGFATIFVSRSSSTCSLIMPPLFDMGVGFFVASPLLLLSLVSRGRWMGWGDGLLFVGLGFFLGLSASISALVIAFWIGAIVGILLVSAQSPRGGVVPASQSEKKTRRFTMKSELPFAPFLALGAAVVYFFHVDLISIFIL